MTKGRLILFVVLRRCSEKMINISLSMQDRSLIFCPVIYFIKNLLSYDKFLLTNLYTGDIIQI